MGMMRGLDFDSILNYIEKAARLKSEFIARYWELMQQALATERPKKDAKGKPLVEEIKDEQGKVVDTKPIMEENPIEEQLEALFMLASYSSYFQRVPSAYIEILVKQVRYIRELEAMKDTKGRLLMPHSVARAKATTRKYIALTVKTLAIDLTKFNAPAAGLIEEVAKKQVKSSGLPPPKADW